MSHAKGNASLTERQYPNQDWTELGVGEEADIQSVPPVQTRYWIQAKHGALQ